MSESKESWNVVLYFPRNHQENLPDHQVKIRRLENSKMFQVKLDDGDVKNVDWGAATGDKDLKIQLTSEPIAPENQKEIKKILNRARTKDQYTLQKIGSGVWLLIADPNKYLYNDALQSTSTYNDALQSTSTTMYMSHAVQDKPFKLGKNTKIHDKDGMFYGVSEIRRINAIRPLPPMYYNSTS